MSKLITISISYGGKDFLAAIVPNVFSDGNQKILIGPHSLNEAIYDENNGYIDNAACRIDEQIYAYIDDDCFSLSMEGFLEKVKFYLD